MNKHQLTKSMISRRQAKYLSKLTNMLPDPDPILQKSGKHIEAYRDITSDAHVFANMQQRVSGVTSLKWQLKKSSSVEMNDLCSAFLNELDIDSIIAQILDSIFYGYSVLEILWEYKNEKWVPSSLEEKPQEWFYFDELNTIRYRGEYEQMNFTLPENKFLLVQHSATYYNPYGEKVLSRCYWPVQFKRNGLQFWVTFTERYGMPFLIAKQPKTYSAEEAQALLDSIEKMLVDTTAVIPEDSSVSFLESSHAYSVDVYKKFVEFCNSEISKAILAQTLTTEVGDHGTYAAAKTHQDIFNSLIAGDKRLVEKTINKLITMVCTLNFPSISNSDLPKFELYAESDVKKTLAERDAILKAQGVLLTKEYYMRNYNLKEGEVLMENG